MRCPAWCGAMYGQAILTLPEIRGLNRQSRSSLPFSVMGIARAPQHDRRGTCEGVLPPVDIMASCSASSYTMRSPLNWMSHSLRPPLGRMPTCSVASSPGEPRL